MGHPAIRAASLLITLVALCGCGQSTPLGSGATSGSGAPGPDALQIKVLSNRADLVSGGDALVEIVPPAGAKAEGLSVQVAGKDESTQFGKSADGRMLGLVTDLAEGDNVITARLPGGATASLTITDFPNGGPIFSGEQILPWPCNPGALNEKCDQPVTYEFFYMPAIGIGVNGPATGASTFRPYDPANPPPSFFIASTTTDQGVTMPYIVRVETGAQDRGVYKIAVLFDPTQDFTAIAPQSGWNHKTYITGGEGCGTHHGQPESTGLATYPSVLDDNALSRGFAVIMSSLDHNTLNCNLVVQGEALMMLKERVTEQYGPIRFTIGSGCSGGSIYQQQVANAYPGIFDGILPNCSFPDSFSTAIEVIECGLLLHYFDDPSQWASGVLWDPFSQAAVMGHPGVNICQSWINVYSFDTGADPRENMGVTGLNTQNCNVPAAVAGDPTTAYDPQINPTGVRCDLEDYMVSILGRRAQDGFANNPTDNSGIQYGLHALLDRKISAAQFLDLNAKIGGRDIDYNVVPDRSHADEVALPIVYRSGAINEATNMGSVAIIDIRGHDVEEIHHDFRSYVMRARLDKALGHHDNQVIWTGPIALVGDVMFAKNALTVMDEWLSAVEADPRDVPRERKIIEDKPVTAHDLCTDGLGNEIPSADVCALLNPYYEEPRMVAGEPFTGDILKCQLKPLDRSEYESVPFTDEQWTQMQQIFPEGVCDWSKPGVGQQSTIPWMTYIGGPGGAPLPPAP